VSATRLRELAEALRAGAPPVPVVDEALRIPPPDGDPELLRDVAADFRRCAHTLDTASSDLGKLRRDRLPQVWPQGRDAAAADTRLLAADRHAEHSSQVLGKVSRCLLDLAAYLETARRNDTAARERIHDTVGLAQVADYSQLDTIARSFAAHIDAMADAAKLAEDAGIDAARLLNEYAAAATAGQLDTNSLTATERLLLTGASDDLGPILSASDAERAAAALAALSPEQRREFHALLDAAGSDVERAWLLKALAAGHDLGAVTGFADQIRGQSTDWLQRHLRPVDPDRVDGNGRVTWNGAPLRQSTGQTCGSMSLLLARATQDPVYALGLATGPGSMADRLAAEELRIHDETNRFRIEGWQVKWWPKGLGTAPGHAADWLSDHTGVSYQVSWDAFNSSEGTMSNVADAVADATAGNPSLLLIGDAYPDHYVLVVGQDGGAVQVYDPAVGRVREIPAENLHREPLTELNRGKLHAVITPAG